MDSSLTTEEKQLIEREFHALEADYLASNHRRKIDVIGRAFRTALRAHDGERRRNGSPMITHPLAVARIVCSELGLGSTSIAASLLHESTRNGRVTIAEIRDSFGDSIAGIVENLERISGGIFGNRAEQEADRIRRLLLSMDADLRVVVIKMADRLNNMRTLSALSPEKRTLASRETLYIYAPLAERLGLYSLKKEYEDLAFRYLHTADYDDICRHIASSEAERMEIIRSVSLPLRERLSALRYSFEILARVKSCYSIWNKMRKKNVGFDEVFDVYALRIIFDGKEDDPDEEARECRRIGRLVSDLFEEHPERRRDWTVHGRPNGYRALHVTVRAPGGQWVEIQIRSRRMDDIAERGYAAHWKYKTGAVSPDSPEFEALMHRVKEILSAPSPTAMDFLATARLNLFTPDIYVLTDEGDLLDLRAGATVSDLAARIAHNPGDVCMAAQIGHHLVKPDHPLQSGDRVKIIWRHHNPEQQNDSDIKPG